jgi:hypothetical protein
VHVTDPSNASRTLLFNLRTGDWDDDLLDFSHPARAAARRSSAGAQRGLRRPRRRWRRADRHRASPATSRPPSSARPASRPGMAKNTYGTGCFLLMNTGAKPIASANGLLTTVRGASDGDAPDRIRPRGQRLHRRRGRAVAARRPRPHRAGPPRSRRWPPACRTRRRGTSCPPSPASARRTGTPPRAGPCRPDARHHRRAHRPRRARGHRLPERRPGRGHAADSGSRSRAARRRRRRPPTAC